ncbi:hypothetical protein CEE55_18150 [Stenotrophomonas pavanii]|uniref:Uncharacterized protein n=1 Tax=Stenotrophomonas pavanii TaxID=487698 RepID=A0A246KV59_9GAMM|nr:hypothetical protein [Stenotrophomonas pavanii]OWR28954.1 hypothetical protein CEE55_18150 [Stenotrophomonas pavanii]
MEFPKMIYLGGDLAAEWRIVADESEQHAAAKDGFYPHGEAKKVAADPMANEQIKRRGRPPKAIQ